MDRSSFIFKDIVFAFSFLKHWYDHGFDAFHFDSYDVIQTKRTKKAGIVGKYGKFLLEILPLIYKLRVKPSVCVCSSH